MKCEPGLKLEKMKCGHCQGSGHKSFDCRNKKEGCGFCGRPEAMHCGDCFWKLRDRVYEEIQAKKGTVNAIEKAEEEEEEKQCGTLIGGL